MKKVATVTLALCFGLALSGCAPEVGSKSWCENMKQKDKGDWTAKEAADYAKHCLITSDDN